MQVIVPGEAQRYALRLVAYAPNGSQLGLLPQYLGFEVASPLNDVPSLKVSYPAAGVGANFLAGHCELAVQYSVAGGPWTEPMNGRFLRIKRDSDSTDRTGARSYDCPGWSWQLRKVVLYPSSVMVDGKRPFNGVTPGAILSTFINEGKARGGMPGLAVDFSTTKDSAGAAWAKALTLALEPGTDLLTVLINLSEQGVVDWAMQGRTLRVFNPDSTLARNLAAGPAPVDLRLGRDIVEAPDSATLEDAASVILIQGENGLSVEVTNPAAVQPWGRWETYQSQGGVSDVGTAQLLGQNALQRVGAERIQITRGVVFHLAQWLPHQHYRPGDYVLAPGDAGVMQPLRVRQVTLSVDGDGKLGGNAVLNDRFLERDIKLARQAAGILAGGVSSGGSGVPPAPESGGRVPAAPTGLIVEPSAFLDEHGYARGQVAVTWGEVTADAGGVALNIDSYELFMRRNESGEPWFLVATTQQSDTSVTYSPLVVGWEYAFKVRATNNGTKGDFSAQAAVLVPDDATPPAVPAAPVLSSRLGVIHVEWSGLGVGGVPMPSDFDRVRVWMQDPLAPGASEVGYLASAGSVVVPDQPYGADRQFWLTSVDHSGNESAASATVTIATQPLVNTDVIGEIINGANIVDGSLNAADKVVANSIVGGLIQALAIDTGHLNANSVTTDKLAVGSVKAGHIAVDALDGKTITGTILRTAASGRRVEMNLTGLHSFNAAAVETVTLLNDGSFKLRSAATGARIELDVSGFRAYNSGGETTVSFNAVDGAALIVGQVTSSQNAAKRLVINPGPTAGVYEPEIRLYEEFGSNEYHYWTQDTPGTHEMELGSAVLSNRKCRLKMSPAGWNLGRTDTNGNNPGNGAWIEGGSNSSFWDCMGARITIGNSNINVASNNDVVINAPHHRFQGLWQDFDNSSSITFGHANVSGNGGSVSYGFAYDSTPWPAAMVRAGNNAAFNITSVSNGGFNWQWAGPSLSSGADHINWFGVRD